jgi:hypothetical protein
MVLRDSGPGIPSIGSLQATSTDIGHLGLGIPAMFLDHFLGSLPECFTPATVPEYSVIGMGHNSSMITQPRVNAASLNTPAVSKKKKKMIKMKPGKSNTAR